MSGLALFCVIVCLGHQYVSAVLDAEYEYVQEADAWLRLHIVPNPWQNARKRCQLEGGVLATPTTALTKAMLSTMAEHKVRCLFTGIHSLITDGDFMSLDGTRISDINLNWAEGEPKYDEVENCVKLTGAGEAIDVSCKIKLPYFCRKENATMNFNRECNTHSIGYEYNPSTGSCYKFHKLAKTWHDASKVCHAEGGHLAVINTDKEAKVITDIMKNNPASSVIGAKHDDVVIIGFWKWKEDKGEWLTVFGEPIADVGYVRWAKDRPNNYGGMQFYGSIQRSGGLEDIAHYDKEAFICETNYNQHSENENKVQSILNNLDQSNK